MTFTLRTKIVSLVFPLFAASLSGFLLVLAFPTYDQWWLSWVALVPLLISLYGKSPKYGFLLSFVCGLLFFPGVFSWILEVPSYKLVHHAILGLYLGSYFGVFGLAFSSIAQRCGLTTVLFAAPFIWVSLEYIRSSIPLLALPWALLGHSQHENLLFIQLSSFTGAYGVSFMIVLVNATVAAIVLTSIHRLNNHKPASFKTPSRRRTISIMVATLALVGLALLYGKETLSDPFFEERVRVSVVQGNIEQSKKWDRKNANFIMETLANLSREASEDRPELIVWPEAATPGFILKTPSLMKQMRSLIKETKTYYLIGSSEYPKFAKSPLETRKFGNTAVFFSPEGKVLGQYLKIHLVPFAEYIPYDDIISWPDFIVPKGKRSFQIQGEEFTLFEFHRIKFGVAICWETLFPGLIRQFVKKGASFMININNEAWFGETAFPYQFLAINVFRAVENRISIVRAGNTGISCFIDPLGRITRRFQVNNKDIFVQGYLTQKVPLSEERAFYTIYGDIFAYVSLITTFLVFVLSFSRSKK